MTAGSCLSENRWTDRLKILGWNDGLASEPGVHAACGAEHVQQLVIHWMAMGTLDYPFARTHREAKRSLRTAFYGEARPPPESLERVLSENPQSLASILLALISALGGQHNSLPAEEMEEEAALVLT